MKSSKILTICLLSSLFGGTLRAQTHVKASQAKTQMEMNIGAEKEFNTIDKELNVVYKNVMLRLDEKGKKQLILSEKTWLNYREQFSNVYRSIYQSGSMAPMASLECKTQTTKARIKELLTLKND